MAAMNNHNPVAQMVMAGPTIRRCRYRKCARVIDPGRTAQFCGYKCYKSEWDTKRLGRAPLKRGRPKTSAKQRARNKAQSAKFKTSGGRGKYKASTNMPNKIWMTPISGYIHNGAWRWGT